MSSATPSIRLDRNELPFLPDSLMLGQLGDILRQANRYPSEAWQTRAVELIAADNGCRPDEVLLGAGSSRLLDLIWRATVTPGATVAYASPGFEMYPVYTRQQRGVPIEAPLTAGLGTDLDRLAEIGNSERPALIAVINPHSPSGVRVHAADIADFVARVPREVVVVLDEAYREFDEDADPRASADLATSVPNVVVTRTFSKAYGLAGLRIGYAIASPQLIARINDFSMPFTVSDLACAAAVEVLRHPAQHLARMVELRAERARLTAELRDCGFDAVDSATNFVLVPGRPGFAEHLRALGIAVSTSALGTRLTVGDRHDRATVIAAARQYGSRLGSTTLPA
ncbi:pyridoxal phosphate-dependent aminotransferase [Streptomyces sp. RPT161]|uniref:pyridoxal phosphate-dependent aminotransferase n=1 Tax=Streptomyces sp. RPT161 TaxID=3015993 RepID=UPI0022B87AC5|nr:aminotransferase class I/II-fold pyridoxal phosphate-dependent enzyme [Streptomyces sp. RPT161]